MHNKAMEGTGTECRALPGQCCFEEHGDKHISKCPSHCLPCLMLRQGGFNVVILHLLMLCNHNACRAGHRMQPQW